MRTAHTSTPTPISCRTARAHCTAAEILIPVEDTAAKAAMSRAATAVVVQGPAPIPRANRAESAVTQAREASTRVAESHSPHPPRNPANAP